MIFGETDDHPFVPKWKHPVIPGRYLPGHDRDIDGITCEDAKYLIAAAVDGAYIDFRKAPMVFDQRCVRGPGLRGGINADRQRAKFVAASAPEAPELCVHVIEYPLGARDELPHHTGEAGAAIRPFEQHHAKLALDLVQPPAQGQLAYA